MGLKDKETLFGTHGGLVDVYPKGLTDVLPVHQKIIGQQQAQDPAIWLKSNIIQFNEGDRFSLKTLENPKWIWKKSLNEADVKLDFKKIIDETPTEQSSSNLKRKIIQTLEEFWLNFEQHVKPQQKNAWITYGQTEELYLLRFEDDLGRLDLETLSKYALKDYRIEDYEIDSTKKGGGLGLYLTMRRSNVLLGTFIKEISTTIVVGFYKNRKHHGRYVFLEEK